MPQTDKALAENTRANMDRRFDHALEETFPTSDSVSVKITKGGAIDYDEHGMATSRPPTASGQKARRTAARASGEAEDAMSDVVDTASGASRTAPDRGEHDSREAPGRRAEAGIRARAGVRAVRGHAAGSPWVMLLGGVAIGYALGWMIHTDGSSADLSGPDHITDRGKPAGK